MPALQVNMQAASWDPRREIDVRELFARLWSGRWWIALSTVLVGAAMLAYALLSTPVYRASTVLIPVSAEGSPGGALGGALGSLAGVASMVGIGLGSSGGDTDEALAVLKSRDFLGRFIEDKGLVPVLFEKDWDGPAGTWKSPRKVPTLALAHKEFLKEVLAVAQDGKTGMVTLSVEWKDREAAASWANELVERINEEMRMRALQRAEGSLLYLKEELQQTSQLGIQEAINRLIETQINKRMLANVTKEYSFRVADRAAVPDANDSVRPRKAILIAAGVILGFVLSVLGVLLVSSASARR